MMKKILINILVVLISLLIVNAAEMSKVISLDKTNQEEFYGNNIKLLEVSSIGSAYLEVNGKSLIIDRYGSEQIFMGIKYEIIDFH